MKRIVFLVSLLFCLAGFNELSAQPPGPGGGDNPGCFPPPCVPIDGGISWLLIAGTVYGGKKIYEFNKKEEEEIN